MSQEPIVKKKTPEFQAAQKQYLKLFFDSKQEDYIKKGEFSQGQNVDKFLGMTSKKILEAKLPKPFGCPSLFIQPCIEEKTGKLTGVIWFCDVDGSICVCCREDFTEAYPDYCKPKLEPDDCTIHQGECDCCPSRFYCHPELDEEEEWEVEDLEGDF
jgi:hypothetical protein